MRRRHTNHHHQRRNRAQRPAGINWNILLLIAMTFLFYAHSVAMPAGKQTLLLQLTSQIKLQLEVEKPLSDQTDSNRLPAGKVQ
jgi:hypothetical protein